MAGWAGRPTTRRRSSPRSAPMPSFTRPIRTTRAAGTATARSGCRSSTTRSSTRRSIATWRRARRAARPTSTPVTKETDAGICVTGAKVVATGSALTHFTFVAHHGLIPVQDKNFAMVFIVPTNAPGREADLPRLERAARRGAGQPVRLPAVEPARRERRDLRHGRRVRPVGGRVRLWRHREGQQLLPAHRLSPARCCTAARASRSSSTSSPAC